MIIFLIYILVIIYIYEFYQYIVKLNIQLNKSRNQYQETIEQFQTPKKNPHCKILPHDYIDMSENMLNTPIYSHDALRKLSVDSIPLPYDDTRAYYNKDFEILGKFHLPRRPKRNSRWHCLRDYMMCSTRTNYLPELNKQLEKPSKIVKLHRKKDICSKDNKNDKN
jgi:hypothetical protein